MIGIMSVPALALEFRVFVPSTPAVRGPVVAPTCGHACGSWVDAHAVPRRPPARARASPRQVAGGYTLRCLNISTKYDIRVTSTITAVTPPRPSHDDHIHRVSRDKSLAWDSTITPPGSRLSPVQHHPSCRSGPPRPRSDSSWSALVFFETVAS